MTTAEQFLESETPAQICGRIYAVCEAIGELTAREGVDADPFSELPTLANFAEDPSAWLPSCVLAAVEHVTRCDPGIAQDLLKRLRILKAGLNSIPDSLSPEETIDLYLAYGLERVDLPPSFDV